MKASSLFWMVAANIAGNATANLPFTPERAVRLWSVQFVIVTDATVGNRRAVVSGFSNGQLIWSIPCVQSVPASTTNRITMRAGSTGLLAATGVIASSLGDLVLPPSGLITLTFDLGVAGDVVSDIRGIGEYLD